MEDVSDKTTEIVENTKKKVQEFTDNNSEDIEEVKKKTKNFFQRLFGK